MCETRRDETRWENRPHTFQLIYSLRGKFPCMCVCRITDRSKQNTRLFKNLFFLSYLATEFCSPTFSRPTQLIHCTVHSDAHNLMHPDGGWLLLKLPPPFHHHHPLSTHINRGWKIHLPTFSVKTYLSPEYRMTFFYLLQFKAEQLDLCLSKREPFI